MAGRVQLIDNALIEATGRGAEASARRRINHNFHRGPQDNPHRFLNAFLRGSYVQPHQHRDPPKSETFLVLEGHMAVFCFDDHGAVGERYLLGPRPPGPEAPAHLPYAGIGLDLPAGVWHMVAAVSERAVCFEVKPGPWDPATDKEFAAWAPREGAWEAGAYLDRLLRAD
jgi:cupin fold WbuC family metalloprotein